MKHNRSALSFVLHLGVNDSAKLISSVNYCFRDYCLCKGTNFEIILHQALNYLLHHVASLSKLNKFVTTFPVAMQGVLFPFLNPMA